MDIGESQTAPVLGQVTPDVLSPQGKQALFQKMVQATIEQKKLDSIYQPLADKLGAQFSSRVKNPQTTVQKIAQKRLQGRNYGIDNLNDLYGMRITVDHKSQMPAAIKAITAESEKAGIKVIKSERVNNDTYEAYHLDLKTPSGVTFEAQVHTPQSEAEAVTNHSLRSVFGENPPPMVDKLREKQAQMIKNMPNDNASALIKSVKQLGQQNSGQPLDPRIIASAIAQQQ